jgi:hypothetical protein
MHGPALFVEPPNQYLFLKGIRDGQPAEIAPGADDSDVLARANRQESVLITGDRDFGDLVYRGGQQK